MSKNTDERKKTINKCRRWLLTYLKVIMEESMSETNRTQLTSVIIKLYRKEVNSNPDFYGRVKDFCDARRSIAEKEKFFAEMMTHFMEGDRLKKAYAEKYPDEYRLPGKRERIVYKDRP